MIKEAMEKILSLARQELAFVDERPFMLKDREPVLDPYPPCIQINNLSGIVDFCLRKVEADAWQDFFIHVRDYNKVVLYQRVYGYFYQRTKVIVSESRPCGFHFGRQYSYEDFIIALHSVFVQNDDRDYLLKFASSVKVDASSKVEDNGISQTVSARQGVSSLVKDIPIKNVVNLKPYRTFSEIDQPESIFVFRMNVSEGAPVFSIHEADGAAWKQTAIKTIKEYFMTGYSALDLPVIA